MIQWQERLGRRIEMLAPSVAVTELLKLAERPDVISFAGGLPDPDSLPLPPIQAAMERVFKQEGAAALNYGPNPGYSKLRDWIAERMTTREGVATERENILVTSGGVEALHLLCLTLLEPGDTVIVGAPTYMVALHVFRAHQVRLVSVDLDENGMDTDALAQRLDDLEKEGVRPKLLYAIPSFQNPSGVTMSTRRRDALVTLCRQRRLPIVEDHAYADLRFEGSAPESLQKRWPQGVVLIQTFSKIFAPGVRLGWTAASPQVVKPMGLCKIGTDTCSNTLAQRVVYQYARQGGIDSQVAAAARLYHRKRDRLLAALGKRLSGVCTWTRPAGGFYVWLQLPQGIDSQALLERAIEQEKTAFVAGPAFYADARGGRHLRLSFSYIPETRIDEGVRRLAAAIENMHP